jgi:hypothetical protein
MTPRKNLIFNNLNNRTMAVISKQVAQDVAIKLCRKKKEEINILVDEFNNYLVSEYNKFLPPSVIAFHKQMPHYIETRSYIRVTGNGFSYEDIRLGFHVITDKSNNFFEPDKECAEILLRMKNIIIDKKKALNKLENDIENALIQLRTYKNIETQFPDAIKYLPTKSITSVAINFTDILSRIQD